MVQRSHGPPWEGRHLQPRRIGAIFPRKHSNLVAKPGFKASPQPANPSPSAGSCSSSLLKEEILDPRLASEMQGGLEALVGWQLLSWSCYTLAIWEE